MACGKKGKQYGITLEMAQENLELWIEAMQEVTTHQSYQIGSRTLTLADLSQIRLAVDFWNKKVEQLKGGRNKARRVVLRDL